MHAITPGSRAAIPIGELSRRSGVNIETIRYYERVKVLPPTPRSANGRRVYGAAETRTLAFIRRSRELGFTLDQIRTLLTLSADNGEGACAEASSLATRHLVEVRAKIADLRAMEKALAAADRVYALVQGRIVLRAPTSEANLPQRLEHAYFGQEAPRVAQPVQQ